MITKSQVAELRKSIQENRKWNEGYDKLAYPITDDMLDTLDALFAIAEAAEKFRAVGVWDGGGAARDLDSALDALHAKEPRP